MGFFSDVFNAIKGSTGTDVAEQVTKYNNPNVNTNNSTLSNIWNNVKNNYSGEWWKGNPNTTSAKPASTGASKGALASTVDKIIKDSSNSQAYYVTHNEQGKKYSDNDGILTREEFNNNPVRRYYKGDYDAYVEKENQKKGMMDRVTAETNQQRQKAGLEGNWTADDVRTHGMILNNMAMNGHKITDEDQRGLSGAYEKAASDFFNSAKPNELPSGTVSKWLRDSSDYKAAQKKAVDDYLSGNAYFGPTWEKAKERNPLLTDEVLLANLGYTDFPENIIYPSEKEFIAAQEKKAQAAYALKRKSAPGYIAKDYNEFVDLVNQDLAPKITKTDAKGNKYTFKYGTTLDDYNEYLKRMYADNGDDYYNRSYTEMQEDYPDFWEGKSEAFDADGNPVDPNVYLWLLNNPLTRTVLQGLDASGSYTGKGSTMDKLRRDYGLVSEADVANMYAQHIIDRDAFGNILVSKPELIDAILRQAYIPDVDEDNPVIYEKYDKENQDDKRITGTLNLKEGYKTPSQLLADVLDGTTSEEDLTYLQRLAALNELNKQLTTTPEKGKDGNPSSPGGGPGGGDYGGGGGMPAGGNPETNNTLYSMPEVGNYAAQMILNRMLPTGYDYDYNKRLDKRLADIAAAEQNYKGSVLPTVERTYQDQAANTMANLVAALRANRASGLTSGASRGAQAASDVQAVQAASKENSEKLSKLINDNLAAFITTLANKRATAGNDTASELQGYASPMMTALGEVLAQYNYGSAAAQVNNGGLRRMQSYLV